MKKWLTERMREQDFLRELENRLEENKSVLESSPLPSFLQPAAAYLGFHALRVLLLTSLVLTSMGYFGFYEPLMAFSRWLFWL